MGKMKEEFMQMREQEEPAQQQPSINQLNNNQMSNNLSKTKKKSKIMKKLNKTEAIETNTEPIQETRKEVLRRLYIENGLVKEDVFKDPRGFATITRSGIDKIAARNNIVIGYEVILLDMEKGHCVLKAAATMKVGNEVKNVMSFGEATQDNLTGGGKKWLVSMAEKRAMGRVVLKLSGFYAQGMYSKDEMAFEMEE